MGVEAPHTTFVLADPFAAFPEYAVDLSDADREVLELTDAGAALVLVMLTLPSAPDASASANLRAPLVVHVSAQRALQVVSSDERHPLQQPVALTIYPLLDSSNSPSA
jgi:flagellar assembly factor FliW